MSLDFNKIENLRRQKMDSSRKTTTDEMEKLTQEFLVNKLDISMSTYRRYLGGEEASTLNRYVCQFFELLGLLDSNPIDVVTEDCQFRGQLSSVNLMKFETEDEFNDKLYQFEKAYGRSTVFNAFPSTIYYRDGNSSLSRYELLTNKPKKNFEFYPISEVLDFSFNSSFDAYSYFSVEEKVAIFDKIIASFSRNEGNKGHQLKHIHIFDHNVIEYFHDAPTCTYHIDIDTVLMPSPTHKNTLLVIKSPSLVNDLDDYMMKSEEKMLGTMQSVKLLQVIRSSLAKNKTVDEFIFELKRKSTPNADDYVEFVLNSLPDHFKASTGK